MKKVGFLVLAVLAIAAGLAISNSLMANSTAKNTLFATPLYPRNGDTVSCSFDVSGTSNSAPSVTVTTPPGGGYTSTVQWDAGLGIFMIHIELCGVTNGNISVGLTDNTGSVLIDPLYVNAVCPPCGGGGPDDFNRDSTKHSDAPPLAK